MKHPRNLPDTPAPPRMHYVARTDALRGDERYAPADGARSAVIAEGRRGQAVHPVRFARLDADGGGRRKARRTRRRSGPPGVEGAPIPDTSLFLAMMSHELRSPVTTIGGYAHLLRREGRGQLTEEQREQAIVDIDEEANRLRMLIDNLMTLAQPANPSALRDQLEPTLVHRIAENVIARHRKLRPDRRLKLHTPTWVPPARAVPGYVDQIVENFVSNAEKYSRPRATIDLEVRPEHRGVVLRVLDRGPGIDDAEARQLFAGFYRSARLLEHAPGNGIGLAVCKRLAEAQGGHVWARPRDGGGSEFGAWLPAEHSTDAYDRGA